MDQIYVGILGVVVLIGLIFMRVPVSYAMAAVGTAGLIYLYGPVSVLDFIPLEVYTHTSRFTFAALPLFF